MRKVNYFLKHEQFIEYEWKIRKNIVLPIHSELLQGSTLKNLIPLIQIWVTDFASDRDFILHWKKHCSNWVLKDKEFALGFRIGWAQVGVLCYIYGIGQTEYSDCKQSGSA